MKFFFRKCKMCVTLKIRLICGLFCTIQFKFSFPSKFIEKVWSRSRNSRKHSIVNTGWSTDETHKDTSQFDAKTHWVTQEWTYLKKALHVLENVDPTVAEVCLLGDLSGGAPPDLLLQVERSLLLSVPFNLEIPITQKYIKI